MSTASPNIVVQASDDEIAEWMASESGFLESLGRYEDAPIKLEPTQRTFLDFRRPEDGIRPRFRAVNKARQVGFSWIIAAEGLARAHLADNHRAIYVSYNMEDAKEKISIARGLWDDLPKRYQKKLVVDSKTELAFESKSRKHGARSRLISNPGRPPRGRTGDVYLDELAHCLLDDEIYKGAAAVILRSQGQLTINSTPLGRRGKFWEIFRQEIRPYRHFQRFSVPWWLCSFFCKDVWTAAREAPGMPTAERIERFGTEDMIAQFESLPEEDFRQEYECDFVDEAYSFFPYELILPSTDPELVLADDPSDLRKPKGRLVAGFDVGRTRDLSVLSIFDEVRGAGDVPTLEALAIKEWRGIPFREQEEEVERWLAAAPFGRLSIDRTGLGRNLAENLARKWPGIVVEEDFTNAKKEAWANNMKVLLQQKRVLLPRDRKLVAQFHSIRRKVTPSGLTQFDAERTPGGHADLFWSCALACQNQGVRRAGIRARVIG